MTKVHLSHIINSCVCPRGVEQSNDTRSHSYEQEMGDNKTTYHMQDQLYRFFIELNFPGESEFIERYASQLMRMHTNTKFATMQLLVGDKIEHEQITRVCVWSEITKQLIIQSKYVGTNLLYNLVDVYFVNPKDNMCTKQTSSLQYLMIYCKTCPSKPSFPHRMKIFKKDSTYEWKRIMHSTRQSFHVAL